MIIQCSSCGFLKNIPHEGTPDEIEQAVADTIEEGWRYLKRYHDYICPTCKKNGYQNVLHRHFYGKPKTANKWNSYIALMEDMAWLLRNIGWDES